MAVFTLKYIINDIFRMPRSKCERIILHWFWRLNVGVPNAGSLATDEP